MGEGFAMDDIRLVRHILKSGGATPSDCAACLNIKKRTLRDRIHHANESMGDFAKITYDRSCGVYQVRISDESAFEAWLRDGAAPSAVFHLPSTPEGRASYLVQDLLLRTDWITLGDLASMLFVSRSTISHDLNSAKRLFSEYGLSIETRPRYGLRVVGNEMDRRLCLASVAVDAFFAADDLSSGVISAKTLDEVAHCVRSALDGQGYEINPVFRQNLVVHIAIALTRINEGCYVPMGPSYLERVRTSREYVVAGAIARSVEDRFSIDLPEEEIAYIAIHLAGKHLVEGESEADDGTPLEITDEAWGLAKEMIEAVWRAFRFDFRDDVELRVNLARHLMPLVVRLRYHMAVENPLLRDIRTCHQLPFAMAAEASSVLAERYQARVSDDEVGYIALLFALSLERNATSYAKKHVLVVCASGAGSARLLSLRLQREFGSNFERIDTCDVSDLAERDIADIEYIFTTVPLGCRVSVPVVHVSPFLDDSSKLNVRRVIEQDEMASVQSYFSQDLFFAHLSLPTREAVISYLVRATARIVDLPENFEELVLRRERTAATSFGNLVALPHPCEAVSPRTSVTVALLDHPIDWGGKPIQAVFLVCVARDASDGLTAFYRAMVRLITKKQAIQRILGDMRLEVLLNELRGE